MKRISNYLHGSYFFFYIWNSSPHISETIHQYLFAFYTKTIIFAHDVHHLILDIDIMKERNTKVNGLKRSTCFISLRNLTASVFSLFFLRDLMATMRPLYRAIVTLEAWRTLLSMDSVSALVVPPVVYSVPLSDLLVMLGRRWRTGVSLVLPFLVISSLPVSWRDRF